MDSIDPLLPSPIPLNATSNPKPKPDIQSYPIPNSRAISQAKRKKIKTEKTPDRRHKRTFSQITERPKPFIESIVGYPDTPTRKMKKTEIFRKNIRSIGSERV